MTHAVVIRETGKAEVMRWQQIDLSPPNSEEITIRHTAVGLNFIDVYFRTGLYQATSLPFVPGMEGVGIVEAIGDKVSNINVGDRVAYALALGAYAERRNIGVSSVIVVPNSIKDQDAASMMLKGLTAEYLLYRTYEVGTKDTILVHAAAGGVGLLLCQWARYLGAKVIGTVGSKQKAELAMAHGCQYPLLYKEIDWVAAVNDITDGCGVNVIYDSVGKDTFLKSLDCLKSRGLMISFGQSSGSVAPLDIAQLGNKGSLFLTRPTLATYIQQRKEFEAASNRLFNAILEGVIHNSVNQIFPLKEAVKAHQALENRQTVGATIFTI